jgi:hypothetical protein
MNTRVTKLRLDNGFWVVAWIGVRFTGSRRRNLFCRVITIFVRVIAGLPQQWAMAIIAT